MNLRSLAFLSVLLCSPAGAQLRCDWVRLAPEDEAADEWVELPDSDYYEVVASMHAIAVSDLSAVAVLPLTVDRAKRLNDHYEPVAGKQPYLVRAMYGQAGTGSYHVYRRGSDIVVFHGSLGRTSACTESALIVSLEFAPSELYVELSISE